MRVASFNVENLFDRARALNQQTWAQGKLGLPELTLEDHRKAIIAFRDSAWWERGRRYDKRRRNRWRHRNRRRPQIVATQHAKAVPTMLYGGAGEAFERSLDEGGAPTVEPQGLRAGAAAASIPKSAALHQRELPIQPCRTSFDCAEFDSVISSLSGEERCVLDDAVDLLQSFDQRAHGVPGYEVRSGMTLVPDSCALSLGEAVSSSDGPPCEPASPVGHDLPITGHPVRRCHVFRLAVGTDDVRMGDRVGLAKPLHGHRAARRR
jgi:hypothetical protein